MNPKILFYDKIVTISNFLSVLRVIIAPFIAYFIAMESATGNKLYFYYIIAGMGLIILSDFLDGALARYLNQVTKLGQFLDPMADKISGMFLAFILCIYKGFPVWLFCIALTREVLAVIMGIKLYTKRDVEVRPNIFGKLAAVSLALAGTVYMLGLEYSFFGMSLKDISIFLIVAFYVLGGVMYLKTYVRDWFGKKD